MFKYKLNIINIFVAWFMLSFTSTAMARIIGIKDCYPSGSTIEFQWTRNGIPITYEKYKNNTAERVCHTFRIDSILEPTDWCQTVTTNTGYKTKVCGVVIKKNPSSVWEYQPLSGLPDIDWKIPDLIQTSATPTTLYTAVNLDLYFSSNPSPSISLGDALTVDNGQISGLEGIYWSTTEFTFDLLSATGFVGTPYTGTGEVIAFHAVPEPTTVLLLGTGLAFFAGARRKMLA